MLQKWRATKLDYLGQYSHISYTCDHHYINAMNVKLHHHDQTLQDNDRTVLFYAVANGMFDLAQKLLKQGADFDVTDMVCHVNSLFQQFIGSLYKT